MPQPEPTPNTRTPIADILVNRIMDRKLAGLAEYGTPLQAFNGRDPLEDALEEAIDLAKYLLQAIEERKELDEAIAQVLKRWDAWKPWEDDLQPVEDAIERLRTLTRPKTRR